MKSETQDVPVSSEIETIKTQLQKAEKRLYDNRKWGRRNAQKLSDALKITQTLINNGELAENAATCLLEVLHKKNEDVSLFEDILEVANKELNNFRRYNHDSSLQIKIDAFHFFLSESTKEELEELRREMKGLVNDPLTLVRKILSIGESVYKIFYKDMVEAGGIKNYIRNLQLVIQKQEQKLAEYDRYVDHLAIAVTSHIWLKKPVS